MLFVTVYGPELESLYSFIRKHTDSRGSVDRESVYASFVPRSTISSKGQTKNIDDGLTYLRSAKLIKGDDSYSATPFEDEIEENLAFSALLLHRFRKIEKLFPRSIMTDHLYITLLEQLYVLPNNVWVSDVHGAVNQLELARQIGGVSIEKINAWKRVMESLGVGYRMGSGFFCQYNPNIVHHIMQYWPQKEGTLQQFLEDYLQSYLPCLTARGEISLPILSTLEYLEQQNFVKLSIKQDSPSRPYFGTRRLRGIKVL